MGRTLSGDMGLNESKTERKIIFVVGTMESGGIERLVMEWSLYLKKYTKWTPIVVCILGKNGLFVKPLEDAGVSILECKLKNEGMNPFIFRIAGLIREQNVKIVHSQVAFSLLWQTLGFVLGGADRIIFTQHNEYQNWSSFFAKLRLRFYFFLARPFIYKYTCVSKRVQEALANLMGVSSNKFLVITNSVNTTLFRKKVELRDEARRRIGVSLNDFCIGIVANYSRQKGHIYALKACAVLKREMVPSFKLILIGNGDFQPLVSLTKEFDIQEIVIFLGIRSDVDVLFQGMDCFVLPSRWEGLPLALIEAMATGLPAIASNVSGNAEVIEHDKTGLLFTMGDVHELVACLRTIMENGEYRNQLASNGQAMVTEKFSLQKAMGQYLLLYQ